jgi:hypothetical protein
MVFKGTLHMVSEKRLQHLDLEHGHLIYLAHNFVYEKLINFYCCKQKTLFCFVLIMAAQDDAEIRLDGNPEQGLLENQRHNSDGSSPTKVLETMRNLVVELQVFKADNEKQAQQEQQEINEVMLHSIVTKKIPKDDSKRASKNSGPEAEKGNSLSEGTPPAEDKTKADIKIKQVDHLEGEFKKIKPATFDGESRTGEETKAWLLDIKNYFQIYNYSSNMKVRMAI